MNKQDLLKKIESKRIELFQIVLNNGINSPIALQFSQELDTLLNEYNKPLLKQSLLIKR